METDSFVKSAVTGRAILEFITNLSKRRFTIYGLFNKYNTTVLTRVASLMAEYNGVEKAHHVREKMTWLVMYTEAVEMMGRSGCEHCVSKSDYDLVYPNPTYANICKFYFADNRH